MKKLFILPTLLFLLAGCSYQASNTNSDNEKIDSLQTTEITKNKIVTSFYPIAFLTEEIVKDQAHVINLAKTVDIHEYSPSPQDMVQLNEANLVIFQGAELEPWTDDVIPELSKKGITTLELSHDLALAKIEEHKDHHEDEDDHEDEDNHEDEDDHEDEHHHGEFDPHTWLDPVLAQSMVDEILTTLITIDSEQKSVYEANAKELKDRFKKLDKEFQLALANCSNKEVIVSHDAFGYLARRYDFEIHAITGLSTQDEPSAKILAELREEAKEGITHILVEESNIRRFADTLANETGLAMLPINPLGRGTLDINKDFFNIMEENLNSFKRALNCQ